MPVTQWVPKRDLWLERIKEEERKAQELQRPPWWQKPLEVGAAITFPWMRPEFEAGLRGAQEPFKQYGMLHYGTARVATELGFPKPMYPLSYLTKEVPPTEPREEISPFLPGGALRTEYEQQPWYTQALAELPAYMLAGAAIGGIPIKGVPISTWEARALGRIFGPAVRGLKGKMLERAFHKTHWYKQYGAKQSPRVLNRVFEAYKLYNKGGAKTAKNIIRHLGVEGDISGFRPVDIRPTRLPAIYDPEIAKFRVAPTGTIQTPATNPQMAQQQIAREFLYPIAESPLDNAATVYLNTGSFAKYISEMPIYELLSSAEAKVRGIALRTTKAGRLVPSMRKSGFYVTEDFAEYKNFRDVSSPSGQAQDPTRLMQNIQGGLEIGPATKYILWPTHRSALAAYDFSDTQKYAHHKALQDFGLAGKTRLQRASGWVVEHINQAEANAPIGDLLAKPEIAKLVSRYSIETQGAIVRYAQWSRKFFDSAIDMQNQARIKRGQLPIEYRENYMPWVVEENIWSRTFGIRAKPKGIKEVPELPDYILPTKPFNPRELARRGGMTGYLKEKNLTKLIDDYIETAVKDIFYTNIIHNAKIHAAQLRSMGYRNSADLIERWATEAYGGVSAPIDRAIRRVVPNKVIAAQLILRRRLQGAVFPLNWTWNAFVQTSSIALTVARYGVTNTAKGLDYLFSKNAKDYVRKQCYSHIIKTRMGGTISQQDLSQRLTKVYSLEASKIERAEHAANFLTHTIEEKLTGISCRAAYYDGLAKGYKDRGLIEHASEGGAKTQSMYNREDLPGILRARMVGATVPFQTFAFEVFNTVRELAGRAGAYQSTTEVAAGEGARISRRVKLILEWIAAVAVIQMVCDKYINRKPWSASAFLPFHAVLTGGVNAGNPWNEVLPLKYSHDLYAGIRDAARYGNFRRLRMWALRYHAMGGLQMDRTIQGIEAVNKGRVTDVSGKTLFRVKPNEWIKAITMGVYTTEGGREYIDKMQEAKGGVFFEYTAIPGWKMPEPEPIRPRPTRPGLKRPTRP